MLGPSAEPTRAITVNVNGTTYNAVLPVRKPESTEGVVIKGLMKG